MTRASTNTTSSEIGGSAQASATPAVSEHSLRAISQAQLDACSKPRPIIITADQTTYAAKLTTGGIAGTFILLVQTDAALARKKSGEAVQETTGKESATATEAVAQKAQVKAIQTIQSRARQKYFFADPDALTAYYIGTDRMDANRAMLEQVSQAVMDKLAIDTLPGVTADQKTALAGLRQDYVDANSEVTTARSVLEAMLKSLTRHRMTLRFAADAELALARRRQRRRKEGVSFAIRDAVFRLIRP